MSNPEPKVRIPTKVLWVLLALSVILVILAVTRTSDEMTSFRSQFRTIGWSIEWLETVFPNVDLTHVLMFVVPGFLLSLVRRGPAWSHLFVPIVVLASVSELLQFLVPGRSPLFSDLCDDLIGAGLGVILGILVKWRPAR